MANIIQLPKREEWGASPQDWTVFDMLLGLTEDLLPVVSNPKAMISPNSTMQGLGKTPSRYNQLGQAVGFSQWTQYLAKPSDIDQWKAQSDYGICVQTRRVRAIDVDVSDPDEASAIYQVIHSRFNLPIRSRANSPKFLAALIIEGQFAKRKFKTQSGIVEFLANGQQFIACGTHPSVVRYEWNDGQLPDEILTISATQFEELWAHLVERFAVEAPTEGKTSTRPQVLADTFKKDPVVKHLIDHQWVKSIGKDGTLHVTCPWEEEHGESDSETSTSYFPAHTGGHATANFKCLHGHCDGVRTNQEFLSAIGYVDEDTMAAFDNLKLEAAITESELAPTPSKDKIQFTVESALEFTSRPSPRWIIKDILPKADLGVIYGDSGSGKTFFALDLCMAIALGQEWRGKKVKQGKVIYVAAEGAAGFRNRLKAYANQHQIDLAALPIGIIASAPNLMDYDHSLAIAKAIVQSGGADLVVLDTFAQVMPGANENSGEDVGKALSHCKGINRATGALVLLVHHSGKDATKGARGWSGLRAAADAEIEIVRSDNDRAATITKLKDGEDSASFGFKLHTVTVGIDEEGDEITSCVLEHHDGGRPKKKNEPKGKNEKLALRLLNDLIDLDMSGDGVKVEELLTEMINNMLRGDGKQDQRRTLAMRAIDSLMAEGRIASDNCKLNIKKGS